MVKTGVLRQLLQTNIKYGKEAAAIATAWGWKPSDITDKRVRTHAEEYRDYPNWYHRNNSSHYRWDLSKLYAGEPAFSGGPKIRNMIKQQKVLPLLKEMVTL